jgi:hypothetical protein
MVPAASAPPAAADRAVTQKRKRKLIERLLG